MAENADKADNDVRAAEHSRVVDVCRAMLPEELLGKEPLVQWEEDSTESQAPWGGGPPEKMAGDWSLADTGDSPGEGSLATGPFPRRAGRAREGPEHEGATLSRHLLSPSTSSLWGPVGPLAGGGRARAAPLPRTWRLSMRQRGWRSPNVGWVSGDLHLQGKPNQLTGLGLPASKSEGARRGGLVVTLVFVGLIFPQSEAPGGNLCLLACLPPPMDLARYRGSLSSVSRAVMRREQFPLGVGTMNNGAGARLFRRSYLDSGNCTFGLQLHYTASKVSLRGREGGSLWGGLRPLPPSNDKPHLTLSSGPWERRQGLRVRYAPTIAPQASEVCHTSGFMKSAPSSFLAHIVGPLFGWSYPSPEELYFTAKHVPGAGDEHAAELGRRPDRWVEVGPAYSGSVYDNGRSFSLLDWLQDPNLGFEQGLKTLQAQVLCTRRQMNKPLQGGKLMAEVNRDLLPWYSNQRMRCFKDGWVNNTAPVNPLSALHRLVYPEDSGEPQTVALMLSLLQPVIRKKTNGTAGFGALVGEGTYHPRTGKLCLLACLMSDRAADPSHWSTGADINYRRLQRVRRKWTPEGGAPSEAPEAGEGDVPLDCEIAVTIQYPKFQPWPLTAMRAPLTGRIESLRDLQEVEYFPPHEFVAPSYMSGAELSSAAEGVEVRLAALVLVSSAAILLVLVQTRHLKKHPAVGSHVSLYFIGMQIAGLALLILAALAPAMGDAPLAFLRGSSETVLGPTLDAVLLLAFVRLFVRVRRARARGGRGFTPEEEGSGLEMLLSKAREQRELKDLEGGGGPLQAPEGEDHAEPVVAPVPPRATNEAAAGGTAALAAKEKTAFLLCIPVYLTALLHSPIGAAFQGIGSSRWLPAIYWTTLLSKCHYGADTPQSLWSFSCFLGFGLRALGPMGHCFRDLVLIPQLAFAALYGNPDLEATPLAHLFAYGTMLQQLAMNGLTPSRVDSMYRGTFVPSWGMPGLLLQLVYYWVLYAGKGNGKMGTAAEPANRGTA